MPEPKEWNIAKWSDGLPLPAPLQEAVASQLEPEERIVWLGQPRPGRYLLSNIAINVLIPLSTLFLLAFLTFPRIAFTASAVGWQTVAAGLAFSAAVVTVASVFLLLGIYRLGKKIAYVITDRRVIVLNNSRLMGWITLLQPRAFRKITTLTRPDGSGDIITGGTRRLVGVEQVERVRERLRELAERFRAQGESAMIPEMKTIHTGFPWRGLCLTVFQMFVTLVFLGRETTWDERSDLHRRIPIGLLLGVVAVGCGVFFVRDLLRFIRGRRVSSGRESGN